MYIQKFIVGENKIQLLVQFVEVKVVYDLYSSNLDARFILDPLFRMVRMRRPKVILKLYLPVFTRTYLVRLLTKCPGSKRA